MGTEQDTLSEHQLSRRRGAPLAPHLELLLECERPLAGPARFRLSGERVRLGRGAQRGTITAGDGTQEIAVPDRWMSSRHAELTRRAGGWELVDLGSKNGTLLDGARLPAGESATVADGELVQLGRTFFRFRAELPADGPAFVDARDVAGPAGSLSPAFIEVLARATAVATARVPVLLRGESGTGKEVLAQTIHARSTRRGAFVAVNCGAIPQNLVESELFGHRKGAFSGALADQPGLIRASDGGTLFLDEIGDLPLPAQAALLRVVQEREVQPVGSPRPVGVDLRVVAATHRDLDALVARGAFRHDLLARLDGVTLDVPPLRERREDLPLLIAALLAKLAPERADLTFAPEAAQALLTHDWPLNVRELEQALAGAVALSGAGAIERAHLPRALREDETPRAPARALTAEEQAHRDELVALLRTHRGNLSAVARAVGKGRTQVVRWMERYALDGADYRPR